MQALRLANARSARPLVQRRLLATPPGPIPPAGPRPVVTDGAPAAAVGAQPVRPVVITNPTPVGNTAIPPTPPPPPPRQRRFFRRILLYTTLGVLVFYPTSGWLSTHYETYRDFFTANFPGAEFVADYADEHDWQSFGYGTVSRKAVETIQWAKGEQPPQTTVQKVETKAKEVKNEVVTQAQRAKAEAEAKVKQASAATRAKAEAAKKAVTKESSKAEKDSSKAVAAAKEKATEIKDKATEIKDKATELKDKAVAAAQDTAAKVTQATKDVPFNFSEGVEGIVREAERALGKAEQKAGEVLHKADQAVGGPRVLPDTQRPRELRPETVKPQGPSYEGKEVYKGTLPLGFEPPPGYYIAPPPKPVQGEEAAPKTLPLLVPKVKEFAAEEPIISQLASTIDSLTSSLASTATAATSEAGGILTRAQDDLTALSTRLAEVKKTEKERLEKTISEKTAEFQSVLQSKDAERLKGEQGLKESWEKERQGMVDDWRKALETELESQRQGIEQRLREEVVSQGIELQRRWLRSIKSQVETERGGRLAKLDHLSTSLKQLERVTLDNSATLDENVRTHKMWSALRAVQGKADAGDVAFEDELRVLKSLSLEGTVVASALDQLEESGIASSGIKSFAALSSWFSNSVSPRVHSVSLVPAPEHAGVASHVASATISKIMFQPKASVTEGSDVGSVLARAEWCLGEKDLDGAAREVNTLKGWPGKLAQDWLREARRRLEVQQALEIVATEATLSSLLLV